MNATKILEIKTNRDPKEPWARSHFVALANILEVHQCEDTPYSGKTDSHGHMLSIHVQYASFYNAIFLFRYFFTTNFNLSPGALRQ